MHKYGVFSGIVWQKSNYFMDKSDLLRSFGWNRIFNVFLCSDHSLLISLMKKKNSFSLHNFKEFLQFHHKCPIRLLQILTEIILACVYGSSTDLKIKTKILIVHFIHLRNEFLKKKCRQ